MNIHKALATLAQVRESLIGQTLGLKNRAQWIPVGVIEGVEIKSGIMVFTVRQSGQPAHSPPSQLLEVDYGEGPLSEVERKVIVGTLKTLRLTQTHLAEQLKKCFLQRPGCSRSFVSVVLAGAQGATDADVGFRFRTAFESLLQRGISEGSLTPMRIKSLIPILLGTEGIHNQNLGKTPSMKILEILSR